MVPGQLLFLRQAGSRPVWPRYSTAVLYTWQSNYPRYIYKSTMYIILYYGLSFFSAAILRFTEIDYSNVEGRNFIQPKLQLSTTIAVDLVIEVIPLNLNVARDLGQLPISLDPIRTDPNFDPDTQTATSKLRSRLLSAAES